MFVFEFPTRTPPFVPTTPLDPRLIEGPIVVRS
jgi:hypothetical protein